MVWTAKRFYPDDYNLKTKLYNEDKVIAKVNKLSKKDDSDLALSNFHFLYHVWMCIFILPSKKIAKIK